MKYALIKAWLMLLSAFGNSRWERQRLRPVSYRQFRFWQLFSRGQRGGHSGSGEGFFRTTPRATKTLKNAYNSYESRIVFKDLKCLIQRGHKSSLKKIHASVTQVFLGDNLSLRLNILIWGKFAVCLVSFEATPRYDCKVTFNYVRVSDWRHCKCEASGKPLVYIYIL